MAQLWAEKSAWPLALVVRVMNQHDFGTFPGGIVTHSVDDATELVAKISELGGELPAEAPYPVFVQVLVRVAKPPNGEKGTEFLSDVCLVDTPQEMTLLFERVARRALRRFV